MENDREKVHVLLDGELPPAEQEALLRMVKEDPKLGPEYASLEASVRMLAAAPFLEPPADLTRQVMRRLPEPTLTLAARVRDFFFRGRVLQWNMAGMLAVIGFVSLLGAVAVLKQPFGVTTGPAEQTVTVRLNFYAPQAQRVTVAGDFNRWQGDSAPMARQKGGVWTIEIPLRPGTYSYMFVVDGTTWVADPDAETFQDDGFGNRNAVVRVKT